MIRVISITLLLSLSFQFLFKAGVAGYYFANKAYIASVLCINKENKAMHCEGKCYLVKKMQQSEEQETKNALNIKYEPVEFLATSGLTAQVYLPGMCKIQYGCSEPAYALLHCGSVFHPPC